MSRAISNLGIERIKQAKTLHDLVRKPYKGIIPCPNLSTVDRVALVLMGSEGMTAREIERTLSISQTQLHHALFSLDINPHLKLKRKQGNFRNTQLYYI